MTQRLPGLVASALLAAIAVIYVWLILGQSETHHSFRGVVPLFTGIVVLAATLSAGGSLARDPYWRRLQFGIAAVITLVCGWLTGLSIGILFLPALFLLVFALARG